MHLTIVLMGPCGCGKTIVGDLLSKTLGVPFLEGDNFHTQKNKEKMSSGIQLTDDDRWPWLKKLSSKISKLKKDNGCCIACSALKKSYRDVLRKGDPELLFIYLKGERGLILQRMSLRKDHYIRLEMIDSQLAILEEPDEDENAIVISINNTPEKICQNIINILKTL